MNDILREVLLGMYPYHGALYRCFYHRQISTTDVSRRGGHTIYTAGTADTPCTWAQGILQGQLGNQAHTSHDISLLRKFGGCFIPCLCQYSGSLFSLKFGVEINVMKKISKICIRALTKFFFVIGICWGWIALTSSRLISIKSIRQMSSFHDCCLKNKIIHSQKSLNLHIIVTLSLGV